MKAGSYQVNVGGQLHPNPAVDVVIDPTNERIRP